MTGRRIGHTLATLLHRFSVRRQGWRETTLWSLDLETGGLDPRTDAILSVGMVPVRDGAVALGDAYHTLVRPEGAVTSSSLAVHQILPDELIEAPGAPAVLAAVRDRLARGVAIVHQRSMDIPFLRHAFREHGVDPPVFAVVDTVDLLLRYARRFGHLTAERTTFPTGLADARSWFGLPDHRAHEALSDAVATAELFLVLAHRLDTNRLSGLL